MRWLLFAFGVVIGVLGCLWFLQGTGLVTIQPILCVAECEAIEGPAPGWAVAGALSVAVGLAAIWLALRRH